VNSALQPFVTVALPIMALIVVTFLSASRGEDRRLDDLRSDMSARFREINRRIDEVISRLDRIERKLDNHEGRIVQMEERSSRLR
jgi:hypothetical protein